MRAMGADLEDLMIMEAVRRSLRESEAQQQSTDPEGEGQTNLPN